ncbi:MAG TPA: hypothetical protein VNM24_13100 [Burkholderiales bacterium]|jgi:hypothetical protein|nr:hypothetical protein [Burkholderiales bacterium]
MNWKPLLFGAVIGAGVVSIIGATQNLAGVYQIAATTFNNNIPAAFVVNTSSGEVRFCTPAGCEAIGMSVGKAGER